MEGINVVFAVGDDIIQKLDSLPKEKRKDFVLGFTDNDYFGNNFLAIEELDNHWKTIFQFFKEAKEVDIDFMSHGYNLNPEEDECMLLLEKKDYLSTIVNRLGSMDHIQKAQSYLKMVNQYDLGNSDMRFCDFTYYIDTIRDICLKALYRNGSALFSLEPYR